MRKLLLEFNYRAWIWTSRHLGYWLHSMCPLSVSNSQSELWLRGYNNVNLSTLLAEKVLYRTLKGSISTTYLEPLKGSIHS